MAALRDAAARPAAALSASTARERLLVALGDAAVAIARADDAEVSRSVARARRALRELPSAAREAPDVAAIALALDRAEALLAGR